MSHDARAARKGTLRLSSQHAQVVGPTGLGTDRHLSLGDIIKTSRIGLMVSHLWLFALPVILAGSRPNAEFWIGALYVTVPLGLLIYGWNDFFDGDVDALSKRKKESFMADFFGYRLTAARRRMLPFYILAVHVPFLVVAAIFRQYWFFGWLLVTVIANGLYNGPWLRLSRLPVLAETTATWIYLNILWLSVLATGLVQPLAVWILAAAAVLFFQIAGAIVDIQVDRKVGKITLAAAVGETWASRALAVVLTVKAVLLLVFFSTPTVALLNLVAIPFCLLRPALPKHKWSGVAYVYFVVIDWIGLALLAP